MTTSDVIDGAPIHRLLRGVSLGRSGELDVLLRDLDPVFELDRDQERMWCWWVSPLKGLKIHVDSEPTVYAVG
jgi:hypothetical protein